MITENLSTLKIHKLTQEQYNRELEAGRIDANALYLTPDENNNIYIQDEEPINAEDGTLWVDMDAQGITGGNTGGSDGKSAYEYAQEAGYTGTEKEFAAKLAKETPCIKGTGIPATTTKGAVGDFYMNTDTGDTYKCIAIENGVYTWKPIGFAPEIVNILPETVVQDGDCICLGLPIVAGETYTITFNGTNYTCVAESKSYMGNTFVVLGNGYIFYPDDYEDNGLPFFFDFSYNNNLEADVFFASGEDSTISITGASHEIIEKRYLPIIDIEDIPECPVITDVRFDFVAGETKEVAVDEATFYAIISTLTKRSARIGFNLRVNNGGISSSAIFNCVSNDILYSLYKDYMFYVEYMGDNIVVTKCINLLERPSALPNPYTLTINGTTYDGSEEVTIDIPTSEDGANGSNESAISSYVQTEADRVAALVQSHQNANTLTFIASSDAHLPIPSHAQYENVNNGLIHAGQAMGIIRKQIHSDFSFYTGDMIWDIGETAETAMASMRYIHEVLSDGFSGVQFWGRGNHESGYESGANLNEAQIFANVGKWNTGAVFNPEDRIGGYCYRDFEDYKVRVICINTGDGYVNISAKQNGWLAEALNVPVEDGWGTILLSHCPPDWLGGSATETSLLMQTIKAASGIICCIHGHTHCYQIGTVTGTTIPRIAVPNLCFTRNNEYGKDGNSFGDTTTYNKTAGTANDTAFAVITVDRESGTAYVDYYGARPEDTRTVNNLPTWKSKQIVNLVPTSQEKNSTAVYNGVGYKNGSYPSDNGEDGSKTETSNIVVTGWIPYNKEVIYIKGATIDTTNSYVRWRSYYADKSDGIYSDGSTIGNFFTIETLGDKYYKLTPKTTIAISAYYRISLVGTGENLIITHDQPIE